MLPWITLRRLCNGVTLGKSIKDGREGDMQVSEEHAKDDQCVLEIARPIGGQRRLKQEERSEQSEQRADRIPGSPFFLMHCCPSLVSQCSFYFVVQELLLELCSSSLPPYHYLESSKNKTAKLQVTMPLQIYYMLSIK